VYRRGSWTTPREKATGAPSSLSSGALSRNDLDAPDARRDIRILGWLFQDLLRGRRKGWKEPYDRLGPDALRLGLADETSAAPPSGSRHARA
jgi:hypothetical protein